MVDSVKIYGKTKDSFGWPEESDDSIPSGGNSSNQQIVASAEGEQNSGNKTQLSKLEK